MIDHSLVISAEAGLIFHLKQGFFLYAWPMIVGFLTIIGYQLLGRLAQAGTVKWPYIFGIGSVVSMVSMMGWVMMVRGIHMVPFYGCGVGLASAMASRVYAITIPRHPRLKMPLPKVIWRGDTEGIEKLRQALRARV